MNIIHSCVVCGGQKLYNVVGDLCAFSFWFLFVCWQRHLLFSLTHVFWKSIRRLDSWRYDVFGFFFLFNNQTPRLPTQYLWPSQIRTYITMQQQAPHNPPAAVGVPASPVVPGYAVVQQPPAQVNAPVFNNNVQTNVQIAMVSGRMKQPPNCCCRCFFPCLAVCMHEGCTVNLCITCVCPYYAWCCWWVIYLLFLLLGTCAIMMFSCFCFQDTETNTRWRGSKNGANVALRQATLIVKTHICNGEVSKLIDYLFCLQW